jgi:hypothetical protein
MSETNGSLTGRDPRGWFSKGNRIAAGNPTNVRIRDLRRTLLECATEPDIRDLYASLMGSARGGDTAAARLLLEYVVGKPASGIEVSGPSGDQSPLMEVIMPVIVKVLDKYPDIRVELAEALGQVGVPTPPPQAPARPETKALACVRRVR